MWIACSFLLTNTTNMKSTHKTNGFYCDDFDTQRHRRSVTLLSLWKSASSDTEQSRLSPGTISLSELSTEYFHLVIYNGPLLTQNDLNASFWGKRPSSSASHFGSRPGDILTGQRIVHQLGRRPSAFHSNCMGTRDLITKNISWWFGLSHRLGFTGETLVYCYAAWSKTS